MTSKAVAGAVVAAPATAAVSAQENCVMGISMSTLSAPCFAAQEDSAYYAAQVLPHGTTVLCRC